MELIETLGDELIDEEIKTIDEEIKTINDKLVEVETEEEDFEAKFKQIDNELNYTTKCFIYSFEEMPNDRFEFTTEKTIFITYEFNCFCYKDSNLYGHKAFFRIQPTNNRDYITYGDIFIQSDKQMKAYLDEWIISKNLTNISYNTLLCNHVFIEFLDKKTPIQYNLYCGS